MSDYEQMLIKKENLQQSILNAMRANETREAFKLCKKLANAGWYNEATQEIIIMLFREIVGIRYLNTENSNTKQNISYWLQLLQKEKAKVARRKFVNFLNLLHSLTILPEDLTKFIDGVKKRGEIK